MDRRRRTERVKAMARELGFSFTGVSKAEFLEEEAPRLEAWLREGRHGRMAWMENWFDKRLDPTLLVPGARSVLTLLYNHYTPTVPADPGAPRVSRYAYGEDYHHVLKRKLRTLVERIREEIGDVEGRVFVDSAPVLERAWARRSGTGWVGKNTMLIHPRAGSWFFLAELITDLDLEPDGPMPDRCGSCTACMDACPTGALDEPYRIDASRCISYLTIELKDAGIPDAFRDRMAGWAFGCDICQEVCPWTRFAKRHAEPAFEPHPELLDMDRAEWRELTREVFGKLFRRSAVKRAGYRGLRRNLDYLGLRPAREDGPGEDA